MALDWGTGVSRTLDAVFRQFSGVVWQKNHPPLDSELNLMSQDYWESLSQTIRSLMPSGFFMDPTRATNDYRFNSNWVNYFLFGNPRTPTGVLESVEKNPVVWANVNGWVIPVAGTNVAAEGDLSNLIKLYPAPQTDTRIDLVFLEAWQCRVDSNPATVNKPAADLIYKYGNVLYGGTNLDDDLLDPDIRYETTARIQVQYRIRVFGSGAGLGGSSTLSVYPDGLGDPNVLGQGTATLPVGGFVFANMRQELGDPSLWRAGDGNPNNALGTVDGYVYAIPICAVFRRASQAYTAINTAGNPTQNGAFERTPGVKFLADPLTGDRALLTASLTNLLPSTAGISVAATVQVTNLNGCGLEDTSHVLTSTFLVIGDEIIGISNVNLIAGTITIPVGGRGRYGTVPAGHQAGSTISFWNSRPDGLFADQVASTDILDLRRAVNAADWDYTRLLNHNVASLANGDLRTAWKKSDTGDTQGTLVHEVDYLYQAGAVPNYTFSIDGFDGIRTIWSDAAVPQFDITHLLDNDATQDTSNLVGYTNDTFDDTVFWDVAPGLFPSGFMNVAAGAGGTANTWRNGSCLFFFTGGTTGNEGARASFKTDHQVIRPLMPYEYWKTGYPVVSATNGNQNPWTLRFLDQKALEPAPPELSTPGYETRHVGPMYPWRDLNFEFPFLVLGGLLHSDLRFISIPATSLTTVVGTERVNEIDLGLGIDFDTAGVWYSVDSSGNFETDPNSVTHPLMNGRETLYDMITDGGRDHTGSSSKVYVIVYGDTVDRENNGAFKVTGAGTVSYSSQTASNAHSIRVEPVTAEFSALFSFNDSTGESVFVEFRSQESNSDDTSMHGAVPPVPDIAVVLTDIGGELDTHPWYKDYLGYGTAYDLSLPVAADTFVAVESKALVSMSYLYHPGRGGEARVPDSLVRFSRIGNRSIGAYLRQAPAVIDTTFPASTGAPDNEAFYDPVHVQTWNRLPALGWHAPEATNYGGNVVGYTEQDREHELFFDKGSKTIVFRPFRDRRMTLQATTHTFLHAGTCGLMGNYWYPTIPVRTKDCLAVFTGTATTGKLMGFPLPREYMPRFGRQDIPYYQDVDAGTGLFLSGINHLFRDINDSTDPVFNVIGGYSNLGSPGVNSGYFATGMAGVASDYGRSYVAPVPAATPYIGARKTTDLNPLITYAPEIIAELAAVKSSDLGQGLRGIQLPPCYGMARVYGVYDERDFIAAGGLTFKSDRSTPEPNGAPNLLRQDADQQTLFILQDGAKDFTAESGYHTYIIPDNALDITRAINYAPGDEFSDYHYIVECSFFGFSKGWIDENNFVVIRRFSGTGFENIDGANPQLEGIHMILPCAAALNDQAYSAYNRTVYQGDVYQSRRGGAITVSDYESRYGQIAISDQYLLETPIQQFDTLGNFVPQTPNPKSFEVLSSLDFYTTLGTGKVGGELVPGTSLDVGYTEDTSEAALRHPSSSSQYSWRVEPRAFTEGQKENTNRAQLGLTILDQSTINPVSLEHAVIKFTLLDGTAVQLYGAEGATNKANLIGFGVSVDDIYDVDTYSVASDEGLYTHTFGATTIAPGRFYDQVESVGSAIAGTSGDSVIVNYPITPASPNTDNIQIRAYVTATNQVTLRVINTWPWSAFRLPQVANVSQPAIIDYTIAGGAPVTILANSSLGFTAIPFSGADLARNQMVVVTDTNPGFGGAQDAIFWTGYVDGAGTVTIYGHNTADAGTGDLRNRVLRIALLDEELAAEHTYNLNGLAVQYRVVGRRGTPVETANNLAELINNHTALQRSITARTTGDNQVIFEALPTGAEGNGIRTDIFMWSSTGIYTRHVYQAFRLDAPYSNNHPIGSYLTGSYLVGGADFPYNAGIGTSPLKLTGMIERLPLGALLQDSDFLCENPLNDNSTAMKSLPVGPRPIQTLMPLTDGGNEYTRFYGSPGELVNLADGTPAVGDYVPYTTATPVGTRKFRLYRGGGSAFVLSGDVPGGPIDWVTETFSKSLQPVLKGGCLACRAMLVRNFYEEVSAGPHKVSDGDEIQMVVLTYGLLGSGNTQDEGITLSNIISPTGYGEGYAAADRYRIAGRPMLRSFSREIPDPTTVTLTVYPETNR
jgi:hypothetical protein